MALQSRRWAWHLNLKQKGNLMGNGPGTVLTRPEKIGTEKGEIWGNIVTKMHGPHEHTKNCNSQCRFGYFADVRYGEIPPSLSLQPSLPGLARVDGQLQFTS